MSLRIRLTSTGKHHQRSYRIIVTEQRSKRDGKNIAVLGFYNPNVNPPLIKIDKEAYHQWTIKGARPSVAIEKLVEKKE